MTQIEFFGGPYDGSMIACDSDAPPCFFASCCGQEVAVYYFDSAKIINNRERLCYWFGGYHCTASLELTS